MLSIKNLSVYYSGIRVVNDVSFDCEKGKIVIIIGANGAGKTTIIKAIMGLIKSENKEMIYDGEDISKLKPYQRAGIGITICPEGRQLFPDMTVLENMEMGAYARRDKQKIQNDMQNIWLRFPRLKERMNQKAGTLSGGEQEMLSIARALMGAPRLLILDEPSWGLAPMMVEEVLRIMREINRDTGLTVLLVEQNANVALRYCDYAYVLDVGNIAFSGTGDEIRNDPKVQEIYLGA
jgi:branched-chain amino acid transport system ATP-binding protein